MRADDRIERSRVLYERALFEGDARALAEGNRELDAVEADLALARGRLIHGRFLERQADDLKQSNPEEGPRELALFERAARLYRELGDGRGEAESLFWIGCCHQVVQHDDAAAVPVLERSLELASTAGSHHRSHRARPGQRGERHCAPGRGSERRRQRTPVGTYSLRRGRKIITVGMARRWPGHDHPMPVSIFERKPERCPFGHQLWPGMAQVSWKPCICAAARERADDGRGMGHVWVLCEACHEQLRETTFYEPPHDISAAGNRVQNLNS